MRALPFLLALMMSAPALAGGPPTTKQRIDTRQQVLEEQLREYDTPQDIIRAVEEPVVLEPDLMPDRASDRLMDRARPPMGTSQPATVMAADQGFQVQVLVSLAEINKDLSYLTDELEKGTTRWASDKSALEERIKELEAERERIIGVVKYGAFIVAGISGLAGLWGWKVGFRRKQGA